MTTRVTVSAHPDHQEEIDRAAADLNGVPAEPGVFYFPSDDHAYSFSKFVGKMDPEISVLREQVLQATPAEAMIQEARALAEVAHHIEQRSVPYQVALEAVLQTLISRRDYPDEEALILGNQGRRVALAYLLRVGIVRRVSRFSGDIYVLDPDTTSRELATRLLSISTPAGPSPAGPPPETR